MFKVNNKYIRMGYNKQSKPTEKEEKYFQRYNLNWEKNKQNSSG